ncbi:MAG: DUF3160 domain-containing protein [Eubacteriales bacterium]|uniref:DUF3160 domain-containing protein n=1 Tax=Fenollaria sp. TaxID=1965292 RepID=UPI002A75043E|nr:DUF3160 domain-containing protein [Fenollaria sp.]MDD7339546.1 DUF3160 domain-containing protein [Eubacteriales bacterium]MDY3105379.1 DUF3160 domain-containing protein [Fenollaria sp.]
MKKRLLAMVLLLVMTLSACSSPFNKMGGDDNKKEEGKETSKEEKNEAGEAGLNALLGYDAEKLLDVEEVKDFEEIDVEANVKPYEVPKNYKMIHGFAQDEYSKSYNEHIMQNIINDGFFINYEKFEQPFSLYEMNQYTFGNSFITTDSIVHLYHIIYLGMMEDMEQNALKQKLMALSKNCLDNALSDYKEAKGEEKDVLMRNAALFLCAVDLLEADYDGEVPSEVRDLADDELDNIKAEGNAVSNITGNEIDYSQFKVRGNYTKNENLKKYFRVNMLYSQELVKLENPDKTINLDALKQAMLISRNMLKDETSFKLWQDIYKPISFLVENTEDTTPIDIYKSISKVTKDNSVEAILEKNVVNAVADDIANKEDPKIKPDSGKVFAFLPQRAVVDNTWLQNLVDTDPKSKRPVVSGVDLMALLGNSLAERLTLTNEDNLKWDKFKEKYEETKAMVDARTDKEEKANIYRTWLWVLKAFNNEYGEGYPDFMRSEKWQYKDLNTALASWAQLKHDTILYAKQFGAECGGDEPTDLRHYVEPNVNLYRRVKYLVGLTMDADEKYSLLNDEQKARLKDFDDMLEFLIKVSIEELKDETTSDEDNERLKVIGGEMENIFIAFNKDDSGEEFEIPPVDRDTANVADIQRIGSNVVDKPEGSFLEVGSGRFSTIYVVYRLNGKYYLGSGSVMNYYEFYSENRLDNNEFKEMLPIYDMEGEKDKIEPFFKKELFTNKVGSLY